MPGAEPGCWGPSRGQRRCTVVATCCEAHTLRPTGQPAQGADPPTQTDVRVRGAAQRRRASGALGLVLRPLLYPPFPSGSSSWLMALKRHGLLPLVWLSRPAPPGNPALPPKRKARAGGNTALCSFTPPSAPGTAPGSLRGSGTTERTQGCNPVDSKTPLRTKSKKRSRRPLDPWQSSRGNTRSRPEGRPGGAVGHWPLFRLLHRVSGAEVWGPRLCVVLGSEPCLGPFPAT